MKLWILRRSLFQTSVFKVDQADLPFFQWPTSILLPEQTNMHLRRLPAVGRRQTAVPSVINSSEAIPKSRTNPPFSCTAMHPQYQNWQPDKPQCRGAVLFRPQKLSPPCKPRDETMLFTHPHPQVSSPFFCAGTALSSNPSMTHLTAA